MAKIDTLVATEQDAARPGMAVWLWTGTCICGQQCKGRVVGTEAEARKDAAYEVCSTCYGAASGDMYDDD